MFSTANTLQSQTLDAKTAPVLVQLDFPLPQNTLEQLRAEGIEILHHYGSGAYLVSSAPTSAKPIAFDQEKTSSPSVLRFYEGETIPEGSSRIDVDLVLAFSGASAYLTEVLAKADFIEAGKQMEGGLTLKGSVPVDALDELFTHPFILDATPVLDDLVPYNFEARVVQSIIPLNSDIPGAPGLNGQGIVIGVGDGGALGGHPDMGERILHSTDNYNAGWGNHPDMVSGIMVGAGNVYATNRGIASEAELIVESNTAITYNAPSYFQTYGMTITNNSYGPSFHCNSANKYYGNSASIDQQLFDNPNLLHVFAVGNSGREACGDMPSGYANIPGGPQNAKNTLSVGNVDFNRVRYQTSSAGPTLDGRLKPEISAVGTSVLSTIRNGGYGSGTGTSFAAPNVTATLALLSEAFQRNNPGVLPKGALLKAIACNTADDAGRTGPDFEYGFGVMNAYNALQVIDAEQFETGILSNAQEISKTITVGEEVSQLKVMLYWNDIAGSTTNESAVLENDLDIFLIAEDGTIIKPLILNPTAPLQEAREGVDHLNNIEQVTITAPEPGDYAIIVRASHLSYGQSDFVLTWFAPEKEVLLTCPFGGETLIPGQTTYISWTAPTGSQGTWNLEYRAAGTGWNTIASNIPGENRSVSWAPPSGISQAEFRITNNETALSDITNAPVSIVSPPQDLSITEICASVSQFSWSPQAEAARYAVFRFDGEEMKEVGVTTDTLWQFDNLQANEELLLSVTTLTDSNQSSKRAFALKKEHSGQEPDCTVETIIVWGELSTHEIEADIEVRWEVEQEQNVHRFDVERGFMRAGDIEWSFVDSVKAIGTSSTAFRYQLKDSGAAVEGLTYYRIRMIDKDRNESYSDIFSHERTGTSSNSTPVVSEAPSFALLQNPVGETIPIRSNSTTTRTLQLFDIVGRVRASFQLQSGTNFFECPPDLGSGIFVLKVAGDSSNEVVKMIRR